MRKARALFVVLALSEQQTAPRRFLARLLWSRNEAAQSLARLRDTLRTLRQSLIDTLGDADILDATQDRVGLRPGTIRIVTELSPSDSSIQAGTTLALDLEGIDPALDEWLRAMRGRVRAPPAPASQRGDDAGLRLATPSPKRGSVLGVSVRNAIGPQSR